MLWYYWRIADVLLTINEQFFFQRLKDKTKADANKINNGIRQGNYEVVLRRLEDNNIF